MIQKEPCEFLYWFIPILKQKIQIWDKNRFPNLYRSAIYLLGTNVDFSFYFHTRMTQFYNEKKEIANVYIISVSILNKEHRFGIKLDLLIGIAVRFTYFGF